MVGRLRADGVRGDHAVAQPGDQHRPGCSAIGQQFTQQRAQGAAGAGEGVLLAPHERVQLERDIPAAGLADFARGGLAQNVHLAH